MSLPTELYFNIFHYMGKSDLAKMSLVNKKFHAIASTVLYEHVKFNSVEQRTGFTTLLLELVKSKSMNSRGKNMGKLIKSWKRDSGIDLASLAGESEDEGVQSDMYDDEVMEITSMIKSIDIGFGGMDIERRQDLQGQSQSQSQTAPAQSEKVYGSEWSHRFISPVLVALGDCELTNCKNVNLSGTQFYDTALAEYLESTNAQFIEKLDLSRTSIRDLGVRSIHHCVNLKTLDLSGVYNFRRNSRAVLLEVVSTCKNLETLILRDCRDVYPEHVEEMNKINPSLTVILS